MVGVVQHVFSNTIGNATGTVSVWNTAGVSTTANATNLIRPQDWNSTHNQTVTLSGNTAGFSTVGGTNILLYGGSNITLSGDTANSQVILSGGVFTGNAFRPYEFGNNTSWSQLGQNSLYLLPCYPDYNVSVSALRVFLSFGGTTTTASARIYRNTMSFCLYQFDTGANSTQMTSQNLVTASFVASLSSTAASFTVAAGGSSFSTTGTGALTNAYMFKVPFTTLLSAGGSYFLGIANSTSTSNQASAQAIAMLGLTNMSSNFGILYATGLTAQAAGNIPNWDGVLYTSTSGAWPGTIPFASLSRPASGYVPYVEWINQGFN